MPTPDRVARAKSKTDCLVDTTRHLLLLRATNEIVLYSDTLASQIGRSYAMHAFKALQQSLHENELTRLCALWDLARNEKEVNSRNSIPAVACLVDDKQVEAVLRQEAFDARAGGFRSAPRIPIQHMQAEIDEAYRSELETTANKHADKVSEWIDDAKKATKATIDGDVLKSVIDHRNTKIAHVLSPHFYNAKSPMRKAKYGDEEKLLDVTVDVVNKLHLAVNGASFDWDDAKDQAKRNAKAFWHGVTINARQ